MFSWNVYRGLVCPLPAARLQDITFPTSNFWQDGEEPASKTWKKDNFGGLKVCHHSRLTFWFSLSKLHGSLWWCHAMQIHCFYLNVISLKKTPVTFHQPGMQNGTAEAIPSKEVFLSESLSFEWGNCFQAPADKHIFKPCETVCYRALSFLFLGMCFILLLMCWQATTGHKLLLLSFYSKAIMLRMMSAKEKQSQLQECVPLNEGGRVHT